MGITEGVSLVSEVGGGRTLEHDEINVCVCVRALFLAKQISHYVIENSYCSFHNNGCIPNRNDISTSVGAILTNTYKSVSLHR